MTRFMPKQPKNRQNPAHCTAYKLYENLDSLVVYNVPFGESRI